MTWNSGGRTDEGDDLAGLVFSLLLKSYMPMGSMPSSSIVPGSSSNDEASTPLNHESMLPSFEGYVPGVGIWLVGSEPDFELEEED